MSNTTSILNLSTPYEKPKGYLLGVENAGASTNNFFVIDISDPLSPYVAGNVQYTHFNQAMGIAVYPEENSAYVVGRANRRVIRINLQDPTNPLIGGTFQPADANYYARKIGVDRDTHTLYVYLHKSGDTDGRFYSYDLLTSLSAPTQLDYDQNTDYYAMQSSFFDYKNKKAWFSTLSNGVVLWDFTNRSDIQWKGYKQDNTNLDGVEALAAVNYTAVAIEADDNDFAKIVNNGSGSYTITNSGTPGKSTASNGQGIRLSDGRCYYALNNWTNTGSGFRMPTCTISDDEVVGNYGYIDVNDVGATFQPCCIATDNTENYLYFLSSDTTSSDLLVVDISQRTTATTVSKTTLTNYGVSGNGANLLIHYTT